MESQLKILNSGLVLHFFTHVLYNSNMNQIKMKFEGFHKKIKMIEKALC